MAGDRSWHWTDRGQLRDVQYRTDANLAARQAIYAYRHPRHDLAAAVFALADLRGDETVVDVGCGNGNYLAELSRRGHAGPVLGVDFAPGMLAAARHRAPAAALTAGDAARLPVRAAVSHLTLAMHMLYHVPAPLAAVRELRRVTRPGGRVLVVLNAADHLRELRELVSGAVREVSGEGWAFSEGLDLAAGQELLAGEFGSVSRHEFAGELRIPGPGPVIAYARSMLGAADLADPHAFTAAVARRLPADAPFRVRTHTGCLVCS
jgi:SAM-dependent methyltransferase